MFRIIQPDWPWQWRGEGSQLASHILVLNLGFNERSIYIRSQNSCGMTIWLFIVAKWTERMFCWGRRCIGEFRWRSLGLLLSFMLWSQHSQRLLDEWKWKSAKRTREKIPKSANLQCTQWVWQAVRWAPDKWPWLILPAIVTVTAHGRDHAVMSVCNLKYECVFIPLAMNRLKVFLWSEFFAYIASHPSTPVYICRVSLTGAHLIYIFRI